MLERDGQWRPWQTLLAFDIRWPEFRCPIRNCAVRWVDAAIGMIGEFFLTDFVIEPARRLVNAGLTNYQTRRSALWRDNADMWPGQTSALTGLSDDNVVVINDSILASGDRAPVDITQHNSFEWFYCHVMTGHTSSRAASEFELSLDSRMATQLARAARECSQC